MYQESKQRYDSMNYFSCGNSGLKLPIVSLGLWHNYGSPYGKAEINLGKIMKEELGSYRDELLISTNAGYDMWEGPYGNWGSRKYLLASLDQSLKRMGLEYVDIFYRHRMDPNTPLEETMGVLDQAVKSGKALYAGLSNYNGEQLAEASSILKELKCPFIINQNRYSIFDCTIENNSLKKLNDPAAERGQSLAQMALAWILHDGIVTSILIGASKPQQILENIEATQNIVFSSDELNIIGKIYHENALS